jgi:hypothetical protein
VIFSVWPALTIAIGFDPAPRLSLGGTHTNTYRHPNNRTDAGRVRTFRPECPEQFWTDADGPPIRGRLARPGFFR